MPITTLPALSRTATTFKADVDNFFGTQLPAFGAEANALETNVNAKEASAVAAAGAASTKAGEADTSASNALASKNAAGVSAGAALDSQNAAGISAGTATTQAGISTTKAAESAASAASVVRDGPDGVAGLTDFALNVWNAAKTFKSLLSFSGTANRSHVQPDKDGTVAMTSDITDERSAAATLTNKTLTAPVISGGTISGAAVSATTLTASGALTTAGLKEDIAGNLGIGVVPSAWSGSKVIQIGSGGAYINGDAQTLQMGNNSYFNGTNYVYKNTGFASDHYQNGGTFVWRSAPSGTAGAAITFTQPMILDASGNLSNTGSHTIGSFTLATRPAHAAGKMIYVSDGGAGAVFQGSNGGAWVNLG